MRARQVTPRDFLCFDHIVALDRENLAKLRAMQPANGRARVSLLLDHVPGREGQSVSDPYYGGTTEFDAAWADALAGAQALAREIAEGGDGAGRNDGQC